MFPSTWRRFLITLTPKARGKSCKDRRQAPAKPSRRLRLEHLEDRAAESIIDNSGGAFNATASNVTIDGFTAQRETNGALTGFGILLGAGTSGSQVLNNIIQNNIAGLSLANNSATSQTVIQHNLFQ